MMWNLIDSHPSALQSKKKVASIQFQDSGQARLGCMCLWLPETCHISARFAHAILLVRYNDKMTVRTDMGNWTRGWGEGGMDVTPISKTRTDVATSMLLYLLGSNLSSQPSIRQRFLQYESEYR